MIETGRLLLRQWRDGDRAPFAELNADPVVMEHFPSLMSREESDAAVDRQSAFIAEHGWGNFAVERRSDGAFLGHVGIKPTAEDLPFGGDCEASWRLARHAWGFGYASEGASALMAYGFAQLGLRRVVAFTARDNLRSQAVMGRSGMTRRPDLDFDHPTVPKGHRLERHLVWEAVGPR